LILVKAAASAWEHKKDINTGSPAMSLTIVLAAVIAIFAVFAGALAYAQLATRQLFATE